MELSKMSNGTPNDSIMALTLDHMTKNDTQKERSYDNSGKKEDKKYPSKQNNNGVHRHNSIYSNPEDKYYLEHSVNGEILNPVKKRKDCFSSKKKQDWIRGKIEGFSWRSQRRLRNRSRGLDKVRLNPKSSILITLTYPGQYIKLKNGDKVLVEDIDKKIYKRHLNNFITQLKTYMYKSFRNNYFFGFTRFEFQKRGVGHYHLLLYCVRKSIDMKWLSTCWNRIVGGDDDHLKYGTRIERPRNWGRVEQYVSKIMSYITKDDGITLNKSTGEIQELRPIGRHWSVINQKKMKTFINMRTMECLKRTYEGLKRLSFKCVENSIRKKYQRINENGYWIFRGKDEKQKQSYENNYRDKLKKWKKKRFLIDQLSQKLSFCFIRRNLEKLLRLYGFRNPKELLVY